MVQGNFIGTDVNGAALGNPGSGVLIFNFASSNTIGGTNSGAGNIIAFNGGDGVSVASGASNAILSNSIFSNRGKGIVLSPGANHDQIFPGLTSATTSSGSTTIQGILNSTGTFTLRFFSNTACDPSGFGEGEMFLGSATVTTDGSSKASFMVTFSTMVLRGRWITATATDVNNNTSEFSRCVEVRSPSPAP